MILKISLAVSMAAAILTAAPVYALSVNIGGGSLISTGNSSSTPAVHVGLGNGGNASVLGVNIGNSAPNNSTQVKAVIGGGSNGGGLLGGGDILGTGDLIDGNGSLLPITADIELGLDLFGDGTPGGPGGNGSNGSNGSSGGSGSNNFLFASVVGSDGAPQRCITPDDDQMAILMSRHTYNRSMVNGPTRMQIVKVPVCEAVRARLAALIAGNGNVRQLQNLLGSRAAIRDQLGTSGYGLASVVAVDSKGGQLIVYVI